MTRFRGHLTRWHVFKASALLAFCTAVSLFNLGLVVKGLSSGVVKSLRRRSNELVYADVEPGWFGFNICVRIMGAALFAIAVALLWRKLRKEMRDGVGQG